MTVFKPKRNIGGLGLIWGLGAILFFGTLSWLVIFNWKVAMTHDFSYLSEKLRDIKVENAELKSKLYGFFDSKNVATVAEEKGLVKSGKINFVYAGN